MGFVSVLSFAHRCVSERLRPGDTAVDATAGTGADTAFLCKTVGAKGAVYAFDIQQAALDRVAERLEKQPDVPRQLHLLLRSHADMREALPREVCGRVSAVMFNLGYLPGGDPDIITRPDSTIPAFNAALSILKPGGLLTAVLYPGHPGGSEEALLAEQWAEALPEADYQAIVYRFANRSHRPPYVIAVEKRNV
ncbi:class I SAM-dependent methyltransferase [Paenibacillus ginsengarvi]|uniref:SAM-dependent methyltransferase n=1 Tax=Paenibacillus ginsengarvi TaxID=400777 RepID=A0A3B0CF01_9BACL|nr:class I SAM-dependent methyltransferase [Paenibacillus ginsengarvi]RKN82267.1 SAM-dependent methyltransferase [Paenibacillus ginsengarvi]